MVCISKKRKFNRVRLIGVIALIISLLMAFGSMVFMKLEILPWLVGCIMLYIGMVGTVISVDAIFEPNSYKK